MVSVVIPTYNQVQFIDETLQSVLNQTYQNLEIIISDDCSTDGTVEVLNQFAEKDSRIKLLLSEKNKGIPGNFNKAFDAVNGEFIAFLGGDDLMYPTKIEKQLNYLKSNPEVALVQSDMDFIDGNGKKIGKKSSDFGKIPINPLDWGLKVDWHFKNEFTGVIPSSCFARSEYYGSARYSDRLYLKHELLFTNECANNFPDGKWAVIAESLGAYRFHESNYSTSNTASAAILEDTFRLAQLTLERCPRLKQRALEFQFFNIYKYLFFDLVKDPEFKNYLNVEFNRFTGRFQKAFFSFGKLLRSIGLLGIYLRLNYYFGVFDHKNRRLE